jgi:uncharacterized tellurite resistance protein B-like protein
MIIFGTRGITLTGDSGDFYCPNCADERPYRRRKVRKFFTLYFIPLLPLNLLGEYIECQRCKNTYNEQVLELRGQLESDNREFEAEYERAVRRSMAIMVLADGKVEDSEIEAMANIFGSVTGRSASHDDMRKEIEQARGEGLDIQPYLESINGLVNESGKDFIIRALLGIAYADGDFDEAEQKTLIEAMAAMDVSKDHFEEIMKSLQNEA